jgi:Tol biopolymer transport system component
MALAAGILPGTALAARVELVSRAPFRLAPDTAGVRIPLGVSSGFPGQGSPSFRISVPSPLSADGRYFVYTSAAPNLAPGQTDANGDVDVFLYDRLQEATTLVSHVAGSASTAGDQRSDSPAISADGRYVAFVSFARDLTPGLEDVPAAGSNVFLYERATGKVTLVSRRAGSEEAADQASLGPFVSADGSYVGFTSTATDLIPGLLHPAFPVNVFLYERASGAMTLVSRRGSSAQQAGNQASFLSAMSADGRYLAFVSGATDIVPGQNDSNGTSDLFLFDRLAGASSLASHQAGSALTTGSGLSGSPSLSADGRYLAFDSLATDLVPGVNDGNFRPDTFLYDRLLGTVSLVSRSPDSPNAVAPRGGHTPLISEDGSAVAYFDGDALSERVLVIVFDRLAGSTAVVSQNPSRPVTPPDPSLNALSISADGRYVAYTNETADVLPSTSQATQVFVLDRASGTTTLVSHAAGRADQFGGGPSLAPALSADGNWIAFISLASDLVTGKRDPEGTADAFLYERATGVNRVVSVHPPGLASFSPLGASRLPSVSGDGRYVAFFSQATSLLPGQVDSNGSNDVFLYDRISKKTVLVSRSSASPAITGNGASEAPRVSRDGNYVLFMSAATNLVAGQRDHVGTLDVFLYDRRAGTNVLVSRSTDSRLQTASGTSIAGDLSADGSVVAFTSLATDLVTQQDSNGIYDVFTFDRRTGTVSLVSRAANPRTGPGRTGNDSSSFSSMSPNGDFIAFDSAATDLVAGVADTNRSGDAFLFQRSSGKITLLSRAGGGSGPAGGGERPSVSADGRYATFLNRNRSAVLLDRASGQIVAAGPPSVPPGSASSLSDDGRYVLFSSARPDVVPGLDDQNHEPDLFLFDRVSRERRLVSHVPGSPLETGERGAFDGHLSADGRYVVFSSLATDLLPGTLQFFANIFLYDRTGGTAGDLTLVSRSVLSPSRSAAGFSLEPVVSARGGFVAFTSYAPDLVPRDFNGSNPDVFLYVPDGN